VITTAINQQKRDLLLIANLRTDSRQSLTDLSRKTGIPVSTIHDRLKSQPLIRKSTCLVDFSKLGFLTKVHIFLRVKKEEKDRLRDYLLSHFNVNAVAKVNSGWDYYSEAIFRNVKALEEFMEELEDRFTVRGKQVLFIIDEIDQELFMSRNEDVELLLGVQG
jgi:Lrp/AsnC family transcriptional regulator, regulator for asnA, asnC and gidA